MKIINLKNILYKVIFYISICITFIFGLLLYDSTTGLDFQIYFPSVSFFMGGNNAVYDPQGTLYFSLVSIFVENIIEINYFPLRTSINLAIQSINFIFFGIGLIGLFKLLKINNFSKTNIYLTLTILCYFPPTLYMRLTMKPEVLAFALFPWLIFSIKLFFRLRSFSTLFFSVSIFSLVVTLKASVTGMVLLCLFILFFQRIKENHFQNIGFYLSGVLCSFLIFYENFKLFGIWFFEKNLKIENFKYASSFSDWNYRAPLNFFYNINFIDLYENPFKYIHSDSMISITLLDTLADYFGYFWNHKEITNLIAFNRVEFTENFLIQNFLPMYISITFTLIFYFISIFAIFLRLNKWEYLTFPFIGLFILTLSSLGFPSNNFNPETGDTFKVHYYSFLIIISFGFLISIITTKLKKIDFLALLIIPLFLVTMGFPKHFDTEYTDNINLKLKTFGICSENFLPPNFCIKNSAYNEPVLQNIPLTKDIYVNPIPKLNYLYLISSIYLYFKTKSFAKYVYKNF